MLPPVVRKELLVNQRLAPVGLLKNTEQCVEVDFLNEIIFSFLGISNLLFADCLVPDGPVEVAVLQAVCVLGKVDDAKFVLKSFNFNWLSRLCSLRV